MYIEPIRNDAKFCDDAQLFVITYDLRKSEESYKKLELSFAYHYNVIALYSRISLIPWSWISLYNLIMWTNNIVSNTNKKYNSGQDYGLYWRIRTMKI